MLYNQKMLVGILSAYDRVHSIRSPSMFTITPPSQEQPLWRLEFKVREEDRILSSPGGPMMGAIMNLCRDFLKQHSVTTNGNICTVTVLFTDDSTEWEAARELMRLLGQHERKHH